MWTYWMACGKNRFSIHFESVLRETNRLFPNISNKSYVCKSMRLMMKSYTFCNENRNNNQQTNSEARSFCGIFEIEIRTKSGEWGFRVTIFFSSALNCSQICKILLQVNQMIMRTALGMVYRQKCLVLECWTLFICA